MSGPFAAVAHELRQRGLCVIPCPTGKAPKDAYKFGPWKRAPGQKFVDSMIQRHPEANIGVITSLSRRRLTVVDIDDPGETVQNDMVRRFGDTPLMTMTPSGGLHLWFRHNGERSTDLRKPEGLPVEIKTATSKMVVVVPPSINPETGATYWLLVGTWDDLDRLPPIKPGALSVAEKCHPQQDRTREGMRDNTLWRYCMRQAHHCDDLDKLIDVARTFAEQNMDLTGTTHPFTDQEIVSVAVSAWKYETEGRNLFGRGGAVITPHRLTDQLAASDPDAFALYSILLRHHGRGESFALGKAMAGETLSWRLPRFRAARACLVEHGVIECLWPGGRGKKDPPIYRLREGA